MAPIKSYTDISQSKKLAEILPLESADMYYPKDAFEYNYAKEPVCHYSGIGLAHPCWSLAALLDVMPKIPRVEFNLVLPGVDGEPPYIAFDDCRENHQVHLNFEGSTPLEAAYNTVCWLLENGYIKKESNY